MEEELNKKLIRNYEAKLIKNCLKERKKFFPDKINSILCFTIWSDRYAPFSINIDKNFEAIFRILDPFKQIHLNNYIHTQTFLEKKVQLDKNFYNNIVELENNFQFLNSKNRGNRLGVSYELLIEFIRIRKILLVDLIEIESYEPKIFKDKIVSLYDIILNNYFQEIPKIIRIFNSNIPSIPSFKLKEIIENEMDSTIAFLISYLPSQNLLDFLLSLSKSRQSNIIEIINSIDITDESKYYLFREIERVIERKYYLNFKDK